MSTIVTETELQKFRGKLHNQFKHLADSAMDLLDALCSNNKTASVVQLSLNPLFYGEPVELFGEGTVRYSKP